MLGTLRLCCISRALSEPIGDLILGEVLLVTVPTQHPTKLMAQSFGMDLGLAHLSSVASGDDTNNVITIAG